MFSRKIPEKFATLSLFIFFLQNLGFCFHIPFNFLYVPVIFEDGASTNPESKFWFRVNCVNLIWMVVNIRSVKLHEFGIEVQLDTLLDKGVSLLFITAL